MDSKQVLKELSEATGVSGYEKKLGQQVAQLFEPYVDQIEFDKLGNLLAYKAGESQQEYKVMLAAHLDEIGLMVTEIEEGGFLRFTTVGGVDQRTVVGQEVTVHGREDLSGIVGAKPPHLQDEEEQKKSFEIEKMYIDLGLAEAEVKKKVRVGDIISLQRDLLSLENDRVAGKALDDRAGVLLLLETLKELDKMTHQVDLYAVATVQEEVGVRGATTSTYGVVPDIGIAVDVCHGLMPGVNQDEAVELGTGPALSFGPHIHPQLVKKLKEVADEIELDYQLDASPSPRGTDAYAIQVTKSGIPTAVLSIPLRYMHTSVETVSLNDIKRGARLLAQLLRELEGEFVEGLRCF
ncbi:M42 family metallopeptidase [Natroniella sulfidigena]|uniref:M42 family metallopeptidase n=1 Tax=Natroniella sulfidigena TaxID=723921 RepID=UPI00200B24C5|nr:M42 family metallopeptidase [Natroniella sulfidigena]MCK8816900.1 M42 family metallopeptidase [Natroniella sulfidigena]